MLQPKYIETSINRPQCNPRFKFCTNICIIWKFCLSNANICLFQILKKNNCLKMFRLHNIHCISFFYTLTFLFYFFFFAVSEDNIVFPTIVPTAPLIPCENPHVLRYILNYNCYYDGLENFMQGNMPLESCR